MGVSVGCSTRADATVEPVAADESEPRSAQADTSPPPGDASPDAEAVAPPATEVDAGASTEPSSEPVEEAGDGRVAAVAEPVAVAEPAAVAEPPPEEPASPSVPQLVPGANISMESVEADGQRLLGLACRADRLPLLGSLAVVGSIAEQKRAFDRCVPKGGAVALTWTFRKGRARDVSVRSASSKKAGACIAKAMGKVVAPFSAECGAVVLAGDAKGADEALERVLATAEP